MNYSGLYFVVLYTLWLYAHGTSCGGRLQKPHLFEEILIVGRVTETGVLCAVLADQVPVPTNSVEYTGQS